MKDRLTHFSGSITAHVRGILDRVGPAALRASVALVFIWFGALKLSGYSPVAELVAHTLPWIDPALVVPALGAVEVVLGLALIAQWPHPMWVPVGMIGYLAGTFIVLVQQPSVAFQAGNPLLLTTIGEFVIKNVVLIAALIAIASRSVRVRALPR